MSSDYPLSPRPDDDVSIPRSRIDVPDQWLNGLEDLVEALQHAPFSAVSSSLRRRYGDVLRRLSVEIREAEKIARFRHPSVKKLEMHLDETNPSKSRLACARYSLLYQPDCFSHEREIPSVRHTSLRHRDGRTEEVSAGGLSIGFDHKNMPCIRYEIVNHANSYMMREPITFRFSSGPLQYERDVILKPVDFPGMSVGEYIRTQRAFRTQRPDESLDAVIFEGDHGNITSTGLMAKVSLTLPLEPEVLERIMQS